MAKKRELEIIIGKDGKLQVKIKVIPNYELEMMLLSFGEKVNIKRPEYLKDQILNRIRKAVKNY